MQWLTKILEQAVGIDSKVNITELINTVHREFPKNAVPKDVFNVVNNKLKLAKSTIEGLQNKIDAYERTLKSLHTEQNQINKIDLTAIATSLNTNFEVNVCLQIKKE